jgi:hypothetical protein
VCFFFLQAMPGVPELECEEEEGLHMEGEGRTARNLSSWRVTIPRTGARPDPDNIRRQYYVFIIDVRRLDVMEGRCSVL